MGSRSRKIKTKKLLNISKVQNKVEPQESTINKDPKSTEAFIIKHNLKPPFNVLVDTNFINDCIRKKKDLETELMSILNSSVKICVTECVIAELESLGRIFRVALSVIKDVKVERLKCDHKGNYADDCIINRVKVHRCYVVATTDTALRQRIKQIPSVPIIFFRGNHCMIERFGQAIFY